MPYKPLRPCREPGCNQLARGPYCERHKAAHERAADRNRASAAMRGYDARWREARAAYLAAHPLCVDCQRRGQLVPATVVDHITPHRGDPALFWDTDNWQPLCEQCHNAKTARTDGGYGNPTP